MPERFGYSWKRFHSLTPEQERQFQLWTRHLSLEHDWKGMRFLDAGWRRGMQQLLGDVLRRRLGGLRHNRH